MNQLSNLALRYLRGHAKRYLFVLLVLVLGTCFISVMSSIADGMRRSVETAALRHYAGHVFVMGRDKEDGSKIVIDHPEKVMAAIRRAGGDVERVIRRTHEHMGPSLFFHGDTVRLKDVFGVDFEAEEALFRSFEYVDGSFSDDWGEDTIVLSEPTATQLRARVGDRVTMRLETRKEQTNTHSFVVRAITADASIYGYARAYVARSTLASVMDLDPAPYSVVGLVLANPDEAQELVPRIRRALAESLPVTNPIDTKEELTASIRQRWSGVRYFTFALPVYISEVTDLLQAMEVGSYVLLGMIMLVVVTSILVTYRVVLHERIGEVGTMLAVGFTRSAVLRMLVMEAAALVLIGVGLGALLSVLATWGISRLSFDWIPGFEIFMQQGRLRAQYTTRSVSLNLGVLFGTTVPVIALLGASVLKHPIPSLLHEETA